MEIFIGLSLAKKKKAPTKDIIDKKNPSHKKIVDNANTPKRTIEDKSSLKKQFFYDFSELCLNHSTFGFKEHKKNLKTFRDDILKKVRNDYLGKTWDEVLERKHCHLCKVNNTEKKKINQQYNKDGYDLYQINLASNHNAHRLIGYKKENIFHIFFNDPNHKWDNYPQSNKK